MGGKRKKKPTWGAGSDCPPLKSHVEIYFLQKERSVEEAHLFYTHYEQKDWEVSDWKAAAFRWILKRDIKGRKL